ncbi:Cellulase (glycosyl hydrolase family 5 protein) [Ceratobasidium sp. AG-Ba]|nr:Cellulase (glycosyl hydrolase family 5 protein) [Ceratobasidium sp. AG-Ba]
MRCSLVAIATFGHCALAAFTSLSAKETFAKMGLGWNLGNTLDAIPTEGSWNNGPVQNITFQQIYADGFRHVRIPITFTAHFISDAPNYTLDPTWLSRINYVVDAVSNSLSPIFFAHTVKRKALASGLFAVVNVHHDSWQWVDTTGTASNIDVIKAKFEKLWQQLAITLKDKSERLLFESINEPVGSDQNAANLVNDLNARFLNVVRNSGGSNSQRVISLPGLNDNALHLTEWFTRPNNYSTDKWSVQYHYYSPWDFISNSWGRTFWGSDADKAAVVNDLAPVRGNFSVPILMGEYSPSSIGTVIEKAAGWAWADHVTRTAVNLTIVPTWWDNGADYFDRSTGKWRDVTTKNILLAAASRKINTIPYNGNGTVWLKSGVTTSPPPIYLQYNGNTLKGVYTPAGSALVSGKDYTVITTPLAGIALTSTYVQSLSSATTLGELGRVIIKSSQGADLEIDIRRYTRPTIASSTISISGTDGDSYYNITSNGAKLATVKALGPDGSIFKDDWTIWLGEPQAGRINWGDFGAQGEQIIIYPQLKTAIKNYGKPVTMTWEFWPRIDTSNNFTTVVTVT